MAYIGYFTITAQKYFLQTPPSGDNPAEQALWFATNLPIIAPAAVCVYEGITRYFRKDQK